MIDRLAELLEVETENYLKMDPDPFDDRNPSRNPNCSFGHMLKVIFKKEAFMSKVSATLFMYIKMDYQSVRPFHFTRDIYWMG